MHKSTHIVGGETPDLAGSDEVSPFAASPRDCVIIPFPVPSAAASWDLGESELDEDVFPLGSLAVRLVGNFTRPSILVWSAPESGEEEHPPGL